MDKRARSRIAAPEWSLQDAKNKLSAVVDAAVKGRPQVVTRRGVKTAVVLSYEDYARVAHQVETPRPSFESFLRTIPVDADSEEPTERLPLQPRDVEF